MFLPYPVDGQMTYTITPCHNDVQLLRHRPVKTVSGESSSNYRRDNVERRKFVWNMDAVPPCRARRACNAWRTRFHRLRRVNESQTLRLSNVARAPAAVARFQFARDQVRLTRYDWYHSTGLSDSRSSLTPVNDTVQPAGRQTVRPERRRAAPMDIHQ